MSFVRTVWADLVDKRLWPVALALVAIAVALPILLLKPAKAVHISSPTPATTAAGDRASLGSTISLNQNPVSGLLVGGHLHDPFQQLHVPKPATSTASAPGPAQSPAGGTSSFSSSSSPSSAGSTSGGSSPSGGSSSGGGNHPHRTSGTTLRVSFGKAGGSMKTYDLVPLSALPSPSGPVLVYLGQQKDGKTSAFLVSSDATPQGDGRCSPSRSVCQTLYMQPGDTAFIDVAGLDGNAQYELDVQRVVKG